MKKSKYYIDLGMKIAFTKRMTEATKGLDKSDSKRGYTVFCFGQLFLLKEVG